VTPTPPKPRPPLPGGPFLVVGLARSGSAAARLLAARGEQVRGVDAGHPHGAERLAEVGVEVLLNADGTELLDGVKTVVKSPGVPNDAAAVTAARERGIDVIGELELAWRAIPNRFVAVTGTNGKTTTSELIGELYSAAGEPAAVAGNVGTPLSSLAGEVDAAATVICECSSFQLEDANFFAPECAVFLNLAPDHLDRHPTSEEYLAAKLRIFANQGNDDVAVFNGDEPLASAYQGFFKDPVLRLPAGTWHIYAQAAFGIGRDCPQPSINLTTTITIVIPDAAGSIPTHPPITLPPDPLDLPVGDDTQDGAIQLTLTSPHGRYKAGDPIEVVAGLTNGGSGGSITTYGGSDGPVIFSLRQVDGPIVIDPIVLENCIEQVTLPLYEPLQIPFKKTGAVPSGATDPAYWRSWFADPVLRLPAGTWEISATPNFVAGGCGPVGGGPNLRPTITIVVTP
jgi:hypothetical protein